MKRYATDIPVEAYRFLFMIIESSHIVPSIVEHEKKKRDISNLKRIKNLSYNIEAIERFHDAQKKLYSIPKDIKSQYFLS